MADTRYWDEEWLYDQYIEQNKTRSEIARACGVSKKTIDRKCRKFGLTKDGRNVPELWDEELVQSLVYDEYLSTTEIAEHLDCTTSAVGDAIDRFDSLPDGRSNIPVLNDREWLTRKYHRELLSMRQIAELIDCHKSSVRRALRNNDIETRTSGTVPWQRRYPTLDDEQWLRNRIVDDEMMVREIGDEVGASEKTARKALQAHGVEVRADDVGDDDEEAMFDGWSSAGTWIYQDEWLTEDALFAAYWEEFWTMAEIANWVQMDEKIVRRKFESFEIPMRVSHDSRRAKQLYRPDETMPNYKTYSYDDAEPHAYDDSDMSTEQVWDLMNFREKYFTDDVSTVDDADEQRREWSELTADD